MEGLMKQQTPVKMYKKNPCPFCDRAETFFKNRNIQYEIIDLTDRMDELARIKQQSGWATVPIIFIGEKLVGGYTDVKALEDTGELEELLYPIQGVRI